MNKQKDLRQPSLLYREIEKRLEEVIGKEWDEIWSEVTEGNLMDDIKLKNIYLTQLEKYEQCLTFRKRILITLKKWVVRDIYIEVIDGKINVEVKKISEPLVDYLD